MSEEQQDILFDLLTKKAVYGLDEAEQRELDELDEGNADAEFRSLEITAAAINLAGLGIEEEMPARLYSKIADAAAARFSIAEAKTEEPTTVATAPVYGRNEIFADKPANSWFSWLGWAFAALACIALAVDIGMTRNPNNEQAKIEKPAEIVQPPTFEQQLEAFIRSTPNAIKANWSSANPKDANQVSGEVVWSDEKQAGYMRFRGLPVNDGAKLTYQLWIFDTTQDEKTPIDGGTFDVTVNGEVVIPINAKLKAQGPSLFAVTVEKPGGVVVSKREKMAAIAKVETHIS